MPDGIDDPGEQPEVDVDVTGAEGDATSQGQTPWDSWINENEIPEPARNYVLNGMKHVEAQRSKKYQDLQAFHEQWSPYEGMDGLADLGADGLQERLEFMSALEDDERGPEIAQRIAEHFGLLGDTDVDDDEYDDDDGEEDDGSPDLDALLEERLAPVQQFMSQQQQQQEEASAQKYLTSAVGTIEQDLGRKLSDGEWDQVRDIAAARAAAGDQDPVGSAWTTYKTIASSAVRDFLSQKRQEPGAAETGPSAPGPSRGYEGMSTEDAGKQELRDWIRSRSAA